MKGELKNIYAQFEELLARSLSPVEIAKIREWISIGYDDNTIIDALKEALSKGKRTIKSVDKILLSWSARNDVETEGRTAIDERWDKNLEETIRIAKTPWVKK
jgi:DnaD/phage-associated family protein